MKPLTAVLVGAGLLMAYQRKRLHCVFHGHVPGIKGGGPFSGMGIVQECTYCGARIGGGILSRWMGR